MRTQEITSLSEGARSAASRQAAETLRVVTNIAKGAAVAAGMIMMTGDCEDWTWFWLSKLIGAALFAAVIIPTIRKQEE